MQTVINDFDQDIWYRYRYNNFWLHVLIGSFQARHGNLSQGDKTQ